MVEIISKADPHAIEDLPRDYVPDEVREEDMNLMQAATLGLMIPERCLAWGSYRVLSVYAVSKVDANKIKTLRSLLGPGTGEGPIIMAPYDWAWVQDFRDSRAERIKQRAPVNAARLKDWEARMNEGLQREAHEQQQRKHAVTTVGYGGMTQRS